MKLYSISAIKAAALAAVAFISLQGNAMPALPRPIMISDGNGGYAEVMIHGDERCHVITTPDGLTLLKRDATGRLCKAGAFDVPAFRASLGKRESAPRLSSGNTFPCYGSQRAIAILVEFPETSEHPQGRRFVSDSPRDLFDSLLNAEGYATDGATGSVRNYFLDNSGGKFDITFDVYGPVMLSQDVHDYIGETDSWKMVEEACRGIDDSVDFSRYDRDKDGMIDNVYIFYAGLGAATGGDPADCIWQHAADVEVLSGKKIMFDGVRLNHYACSNEYRVVRDPVTGKTDRLTEGIGTVCHEFSHVLGLPDLYDVYYNGSISPGAWDLMDTGCHLNESRTPSNYSALDRMLLGWLDPETIGDAPRTLTLKPIGDNQAYRILTSDPDEFFLLENRQQTGWDSALPGHGLLVWRINYQSDYWNANQVNTGRGSSHAIVLPADGHYGESSYSGDPFPGSEKVKGLSDDGYPNMLSSRGDRTNAPLSGITEAGGIITFDICRAVTHLDKVEGLRATDITPTAFTAEWDAIAMSPGYVINVTAPDGTPAGIYHDLSVAATSLRVTGLAPSSEYLFTVRGVAGAVSGEVSDPCRVATPAMSFAFTAPQAPEATALGSDSFHAVWSPLEEAVDYAVTVLTLIPGEDRRASIDFKGGIEALPAGWSTNCISTMSIKGYYGAEAPALSMTTDYGRLQSPILGSQLKSLEFWYRERTPSGRSSIGIEVLAGSQWEEIDRIDLAETMSDGKVYTLHDLIQCDAQAVRIIYHRVDKGSLAIDDIKITYAGDNESNFIEGWTDRRTGSSETEAVIDSLDADTEYFFYVRGINSEGVMSAPSEMISVTTLEDGGVGFVNDDPSSGDFNVYDLQGRRIFTSTPAPGIYILKNDKETKKLIYR